MSHPSPARKERHCDVIATPLRKCNCQMQRLRPNAFMTTIKFWYSWRPSVCPGSNVLSFLTDLSSFREFSKATTICYIYTMCVCLCLQVQNNYPHCKDAMYFYGLSGVRSLRHKVIFVERLRKHAQRPFCTSLDDTLSPCVQLLWPTYLFQSFNELFQIITEWKNPLGFWKIKQLVDSSMCGAMVYGIIVS